jgi:hypothetical protein
MIPSKSKRRGRAAQNNPRTQKRHESLECNKSSLLVCEINFRSTCTDYLSKAIHATDLTLGLRRIPAGFYVIIKADGAEFQTGTTPAHEDQAVVEWNERIPL